MSSKKVIVIGAGIAGLACAARLAAQGLTVHVYERNDYAGGKLGFLRDGEYSWDTGPSLLTQPYLLEELFADCGHRLEDYLTYRSLKKGTQYFWEDGTRLNASDLLDGYWTRAAAVEPNAVDGYLQDARKLYQAIGSIFLDEPIHRRKTWQLSRILPALKALKLPYLTQSLHRYNKKMLRHPKLVQVMDRLATYNGSNPYECPAMLSMISHLEFSEGFSYADGGMNTIPRALGSLCESLGVQFHTGTAVSRILVKGKNVAGVLASEEKIPADAVVSNSDVFFTYRDLLRDAVMANKIERQERSSSGIIFYWGVAKRFPELQLHNIFFSEDYDAEFRAIFKEERMPADPTIYVNITSKQDAAHCPSDCENWFVLINAPSRNPPLTRSEIDAVRRNVLQKLSRILGTDITPLIQCEHMHGPDDIERTSGAHLGALYGTASNSAMAAFNRHPNFSRKYRGLFFAGGTVHPGGGIPLCLRSGRLAADETLTFLQSFRR